MSAEAAFEAVQDRLDDLWNDITQLRDDLVQQMEDGANVYVIAALVRRLDRILGDDAP